MADTQRAIIIHEDGRIEEKSPNKGRKFTYEEQRDMVGGLLTMLPGFRWEGKIVKTVYADDEALLKGAAHNPKASEAWEAGKKTAQMFGEQYSGIHGRVVLIFPR